MRPRAYSSKEFMKLLTRNGYVLNRIKGSHFIYINDENTISVPKNLNKMIGLRLIKEYHLVEVA